MTWNIVSLEAVDLWLEKRPIKQYKSIAKEVRLLELCGNQLKLPHSKALGKGLFELRERAFELRLYYTFSKDRQILLLTAGDKNSQSKDIKKAYGLLTEYKRYISEN